MWFNNLIIYRFTKPFTLAAEALAELLGALPFVPCGAQDGVKRGFVSPLDQEGAPLVHSALGAHMVCLQKQEKLLPAAVVNDALAAKVKQIRAEEDRAIGRRERADLKEEIVFDLLPRAFVKTSRLYAYIDVARGYLLVNTARHSKAEELLSLLREAVGSLPLLPLRTAGVPVGVMSHWLLVGDFPGVFTMGNTCHLSAPGGGAEVRCSDLDLESPEVRHHLEAGMEVTRMQLEWNGGISFVLDEDLTLRKLEFLDLIRDRATAEEVESAAQQFDVDFTIMAGELAGLVSAIVAEFGGVEGV